MTARATLLHYSHDGLRLAVRLWGSLGEPRLPFVCLPGLTRNSRDFAGFAEAVRAGPTPRPVVAFDYRGRGASDRAGDAATYTLGHEMADVLAGLDHLGIARAIFVGTSRGALMLHLLAMAEPDRLAAAVLNDAGPRLEIEGLLAIKAYVGRTGLLPDWTAATEAVRRINAETFPALTEANFARMARANFRETEDGIVADYDPRLADGLTAIEAETALPELWEGFAALSALPVLVLRGEHSALLSRETVRRMAEAHPRLEAIEVSGQGHAPLLETADLPRRIGEFASRHGF
ncbi:alpha/beta hydrolase [Aureimonas endophytica]|uniref:Alpha/beta hydrolase n=1 Tax=Aureimonas endophytica TaxID=2027858 RepID=A0A917E2G3_9HYPH|nr:alpha/beta hydrolase [Aureimonas endophytica]GGD93107.1 alpha/beta hydrolase [Aureimonas endophytica]